MEAGEIYEEPYDVTGMVDPQGLGPESPREIKRGETAAVQQVSMAAC